MIKKIIHFFLSNRKKMDQEAIRQKYEASKNAYDHYLAYGNAFVNFCKGK